jgi:heat shock protein HtpX
MASRPSSALKADGGLQARMLLTLFLLGAIYVVLFAAIAYAGVGVAGAAIILALFAAVQYFTSDKLALRAMGAQEVSPAEAPELHAMIERLCVQGDIPKPKVAMMRSSMPNAFAMGRSPKHATVCATTGIVELLSPAELEGVMAHELAHVRHRDVAIMTIASFFASIASMILQFGFFFGGGDDDENPGFVVLLLVALGVYVLSFFLMSALSRYREFAADRGAAELTRRPSALASALMKIEGTMQRIPQQDLRAHQELAAFYIARPSTKSLFALFSTHPPTERRIAALAQLEQQLQSGAVR